MKQNQNDGCNRIREHFFSFLVFFFLSKPGTRSYPQCNSTSDSSVWGFYEDLKAYLKPICFRDAEWGLFTADDYLRLMDNDNKRFLKMDDV